MTDRPASPGLHHVTALAKDPQRNLDFYRRVLGLRLVKLTVNFDSPDVYHFYFGDSQGTPGTLITFFPFPQAARGKAGTGEVSEICFAAPQGSLGFWRDRLAAAAIESQPDMLFGAERLVFTDADGTPLSIAAIAEEGSEDREGLSARHALQKIASATLNVESHEQTSALLKDVLGAVEAGNEGRILRFRLGDTDVDIASTPDLPRARMGAGSVHHIAWRARNEEEQQTFRQIVEERGPNPTPVLDRNYFRSIYFREPGGVIFEIATDAPGFATDEPFDALGSRLVLPPWLEPQREEIEAGLPPIRLNRT